MSPKESPGIPEALGRHFDNEGKIIPLRELCEKYCGHLDPTAEIERFLQTVAIIEIVIDTITGKQSIELVR
ncbi:MAG: hypothetical protein K2L14_03095 [Duncaniella sp.]|nr:hypothetical protein [Duncaniella sp.]